MRILANRKNSCQRVHKENKFFLTPYLNSFILGEKHSRKTLTIRGFMMKRYIVALLLIVKSTLFGMERTAQQEKYQFTCNPFVPTQQNSIDPEAEMLRAERMFVNELFQNDGQAPCKLGIACLKYFTIRKDYTYLLQAIQWLLPEAMRGNAFANEPLGICFLKLGEAMPNAQKMYFFNQAHLWLQKDETSIQALVSLGELRECLVRLTCNVQIKEGLLKQAYKGYKEAQPESPDEFEVPSKLALICERLGDFYGDARQKREFYVEACKWMIQANEETNSAEYEDKIGQLFEKASTAMMDIKAKQDCLKTAKKWFAAACEGYTKLAENANPELIRMIHDKLDTLHKKMAYIKNYCEFFPGIIGQP